MIFNKKWIILYLLIAFILSSSLIWSADLTIYYTANTYGQSSYCASCGGEQLGGLARRATAFKDLRRTRSGPALFLAGPYEWLHYNLQNKTSKTDLEKLLQVYSILDYDLGICSQMEAQTLQKYSLDLPPRWTTVSTLPATKIIQTAGSRIAVIIFPALDKKSQDRSKIYSEIDSRTNRLKKHTALTIGISSWGYGAERRFITQSKEPLDLLLGCGPGPAARGKILRDGQTAWVRSYARGKAIVRIQISNLSARRHNIPWQINKNIFFDTILMNSSFTDAPQIKSILKNR